MGRGTRPISALTVVTLLLANAAHAGESTSRAPRASSAAAYEMQATAVASSIAGRPVSVYCVDAPAWHAVGDRLGVDPALSWALTTFHWDPERAGPVPDDISRFSPRACRFGASFWADPSGRVARACQVGLQRVRRTGEFTETERAACDLWEARSTAVHVLSHESVHLRGVHAEAPADCAAVQIDAWVAMALGADKALARSLARELWTEFRARRIGMGQHAECHDGGSLDLFPDRVGWPTPIAYPADLDPALSALVTEPAAAGTVARRRMVRATRPPIGGA